jgi:hypothetical protein
MLTDAQTWPGTAVRVTVGLTRVRADTVVEFRRSPVRPRLVQSWFGG